jgi:CheY-like chemotaxis protein
MPAARPTYGPDVSTEPNILVVDDVALVRMVLAEMLRGAGFHVIEVSDGEEAIRVIESFPVRVVVSDVHMPGASLDGLALARWIHEHRPSLKVILASGVVSALEPGDAALHEGPLLQKPFRLEELERRVRLALGKATGSP